MERDRAKEIIAAYGAEPARWPADERAAMRLALSTDLPLRRKAEDAASLDALLGGWARQGPGDDEAAARAAAEVALRGAAAPTRRWTSASLFGGFGIAAAVAAALILSPDLSEKPVSLPANATKTVTPVQTASATDADPIDHRIWSMTFTPTPEEESLI